MSVDHYENFPVASWLLPRHLRAPVIAIYRFARSADDIADEGNQPPAERLRQLDRYRTALNGIAAGTLAEDPIFQELAAAIKEFQLPLALFHDLLDAFTQDIGKTRYASFEELMAYCRLSANPVGRLLLCLFQAQQPQHLACSDAICTSLQLINHWQDVGIDWNKGRVYLPQQDLARFGVSEGQIAAGAVDDNWRSLMRYQVERAGTMMAEGAPLGAALPGRIGLELRLIVAGGQRILKKIAAADYDVFRSRPVLKGYDWPLLMWRALIHR